jgi:hypothetical protein
LPAGNSLPLNQFTKQDDLGTHNIDGVAAHGVREIQTIPAERSNTGHELVLADEHRHVGVVLAIPREINSWVRSQQFPDGGGSDRATLLRSLEALQAENRELRRQLASRQPGLATMDRDVLLKR